MIRKEKLPSSLVILLAVLFSPREGGTITTIILSNLLIWINPDGESSTIYNKQFSKLLFIYFFAEKEGKIENQLNTNSHRNFLGPYAITITHPTVLLFSRFYNTVGYVSHVFSQFFLFFFFLPFHAHFLK